MPCEQPPVQLYLYLDGELAPAEAHAVECHVQTCAVCQQAVAACRRLQALLRTALEEEGVPAHL